MTATLFLTVFIYLLGFGIIIPVLPALGKEFGASPAELGLLMSAFSFFQFLFSPFWGSLSDRIGRRPVLMICMAGECLAYLGFALSQSLVMLFLARSVAGAFGGAISTASAYVSDVTTGKDRSKGMGLIGAAFGAGFLFGPIVSGSLMSLAAQLAWSEKEKLALPSFFVAGLCLVSLFMVMMFLPESRDAAARANSVSSPGSGNSFVRRFRLLKLMIKSPVLAVLLIVYFSTNFGFSLMEPTLFMKAYDDFGWTAEKAAFAFAYVGLLMVFTQGFLVRRLLPKLGEAKLMLIGSGVAGVALFSIGLSADVFGLAIVMTFLALGNGVYNPSVLGSVSLASPKDIQGEVFGVTQSLASLARITGPALGGYLYQEVSRPSPFFMAGLFGVGASLLLFSIFKRLPNEAKASG